MSGLNASDQLVAVAGEALVDFVLEPDGATTPHIGSRAARGGALPPRPRPEVVLVTRGGEGTTVVAVERAVQISARPARVIDTIGAGDAFGGAWLGAWVAEGLGVADLRRLNAVVSAAEFAASVASRTCECAGAQPPRAARVDAEWCFAPAVADPNPIGARD